MLASPPGKPCDVLLANTGLVTLLATGTCSYVPYPLCTLPPPVHAVSHPCRSTVHLVRPPARSNTPTRILVGGGNQDLFVRCDTTSWRCVGVRSRSSATRFYAYPIASTDNFALQIPGTTLCLNLWGGGSSGQVAL